MSSLFSIGEDELDLDDEDCLLAACGVGSLNNFKISQSNPNLASVQTQFLRTKEVEKLDSHNPRRPFKTISNKNTSERACDKKRNSTDQLQRSSSLNQLGKSSTSSGSDLNIPTAKRLAIENKYDSFTKSSVSENGRNLLHSSSTPTFKTTEISYCRSSLNSQYSFKHSNSCELGSRMDSSKSVRPGPTNTSRLLPRKDFSRLQEFSPISVQNSKAVNVNINTPASEQKRHLTSSPAISIGTNHFNTTASRANTISCMNQPERQLAGSFNRSPTGTKSPETPICALPRKSVTGSSGLSTPQGNQPITPGVNKSLTTTPSSSKTPKTRKFPGPAGLLPKLTPGQNFDDPSLASPLPTVRKPSPVQSKVSQSSSSEDEEFSRDPWTYMYQEFLKNIPLAMRYTIIKVYTEAIQQRLEHGKVPCLCALIKAFSLTEADASVLLKDPTGEIHGTLHRKVLENYQTELAPGAGLILKHVSVFSPAPRKHYLNITPGNILQIYPPDPQHISSSQALASQCTQAEEKKEEHSRATEFEPISRQVDCNKQQTISTEESNQEESGTHEDCFEDFLDDLDDDQDLLDDALLLV